MAETKLPFHVPVPPGTQTFAVALGQGEEDSPAALIDVICPEATKLNYERIARGFATWGGDLSHYLFYFRRLIDPSLPLDVRWLNGYRLLEWHFVKRKASARQKEGKAEFLVFVKKFEDMLKPALRPGQLGYGLFQEARALVAHAGLDNRPDAERASDPRNAMEKTFQVLQLMVITVLNEHPNVAASGIRFEPHNL